jgi:hypothetical protein
MVALIPRHSNGEKAEIGAYLFYLRGGILPFLK